MSALSLSFASPFILLGLLLLPLIWWLLRLTPPRPKSETFPPTRILSELNRSEETPAQSPWWLTLLRLLMALLVVLALAEPIWNARDKNLSGDGPLLIVLDNVWTSGMNWEVRKRYAETLLKEAEDAERPVALVLTAKGEQLDITTALAGTQRTKLAAAKPMPIRADFEILANKMSAPDTPSFSSIAWLSDGLESDGLESFLKILKGKQIPQILYYAPESQTVHVLTGVANTPDALEVFLERAEDSGSSEGTLTAFDQQGRSISSAKYEFGASKRVGTARFTLPVELRNEVTRIAIDDATHAGAVQMLDERFRRRRVGLISGGKADQAQPLLSPLYFISRALNPFSEVRQARATSVAEAVPELINEKISTLVLADIGTMPTKTSDQLAKWIESGGMLVRFAGPHLAASERDNLTPVELRRGERSLGGTLTWGTPQPLTKFEPSSPFNGIPLPQDVTISKQVLAEPSIDLAEKTWASLADGTPLVTAGKRGKGWIVLFHVTADAAWSNLPLSGAFVDMLRRIVAVSNGSVAADQVLASNTGENFEGTKASADAITMPPLQILDGFGRLGPPNFEARPLKLSVEDKPTVTKENPPGTYGTKDAFIALNLFNAPRGLELLNKDKLPNKAEALNYSENAAVSLKPWLLALALLLLAIDCLVVLWMAGAFRQVGRRVAASSVGILCLGALVNDGFAQEANIDFDFTLRTRLAYVTTGDAQLDELSRKGLTGLTRFIASRTSLEPGTPVAVDISKDELAFFPLIYWPISTVAALPDSKAMARIGAFMKNGGSVLFDTRDQLSGGFGANRITPETARLRELLKSLNIPPLEPVPDNHVLTRAFYLLNVFPGRYLEGNLWVEASETDEDDASRPARQGDGVSSIMITSNDMAGAWAIESDGAPTLPVVPANPTQRVYAYRTGVNIVMYTLTGNYKSDQVHIPALLERLGQ